MSKKILIAVLFLLVSVFISIVSRKAVLKKNDLVNPTPTIRQEKTKNSKQTAKSAIFVPYWASFSDNQPKNYSRYIYFGLGVNENGILINDSSYANIEKFINTFSNEKGEMWLALRMTNNEDNMAILKNPRVEDEIIKETIDILKKYKFKGLVLDLEINTISYDSMIAGISNFVQKTYIPLFEEDIKFSIALYGDNYYRKRPYDLATIANNSDEILVMAYDFHKARSMPGPNFPLSGREKYGYDISTMIDDFSKYVPPEKLTIIFGMYGYDWLVDEKRRPISQGKALTLSEITHDFVENCERENCVIKRDDLAGEQEINYVDQGNLHVIWFEDKESVVRKMEYLMNRGIFNFAYWAYGYF